MRSTIPILFFFVSVLTTTWVSGQEVEDKELPSGIITLRLHDPLAHNFDFEDGLHGSTIQDGELKNRNSHLTYHHYFENGLTVGVQGGDQGEIIDLGTAEQLIEKYNLRNTIGGQAFAAITYVPGEIQIQGKPLEKSGQIQNSTPDETNSVDIHLGNLYLARIVNDDDEFVVKLKVVEYHHGQSVTLRWARIF